MTKFEEYAILTSQIDIMLEKQKALREEVFKEMIKNNQEKVELPVGKFTVYPRKIWTYPESVNKLGEDFKAAKAKAESCGDATYTEEKSLRFNSIKL